METHAFRNGGTVASTEKGQQPSLPPGLYVVRVSAAETRASLSGRTVASTEKGEVLGVLAPAVVAYLQWFLRTLAVRTLAVLSVVRVNVVVTLALLSGRTVTFKIKDY